MFPPEIKILLAEDMTSVREIMVETFKELHYENIVECRDGASAWEKIQNEPSAFHLIVSDLNMPKSSGLDLLVRIRSSEKFKHLPFLMISTSSDQDTILSVIKAGADHFLVKPFSALELQDKMKIIFEKRNGSAA